MDRKQCVAWFVLCVEFFDKGSIVVRLPPSNRLERQDKIWPWICNSVLVVNILLLMGV